MKFKGIKTVRVRIEGMTPLLINRFKTQDEIPVTMKKRDKKDYGTPRQQAEKTAYVCEDTGLLYIPWSWITGTIATVASDYKLVGSKKSVKSVSGGAVVPAEEVIYFDQKYTIKDIEVDERPCVVQMARIMRCRARLEKWSVTFHLEIDATILELPQVYQILCDAGRRAGLGDFRPPKGGRFGRYMVTLWQELGDDGKPLYDEELPEQELDDEDVIEQARAARAARAAKPKPAAGKKGRGKGKAAAVEVEEEEEELVL